MNDLFYLTEDQLARIRRYFPKPHGVPRVDDLRALSGIIHVLKRGLQWRDAPAAYSRIRSSAFLQAQWASAHREV